MALGHLIWITVSTCYTLISSLTMQLALLFWVFAPSVSIHFCCNSWPGAGLWSAQTHQASCHISVYSLMRQGVKGGGRCCIDAGGHWGSLLCSLLCQSDWSSELGWIKTQQKLNSQAAWLIWLFISPLSTAVLTDLSKKWISSLASVHRLSHGRFCSRQVCVWVWKLCLHVCVCVCFPNRSDLKLIWLTAFTKILETTHRLNCPLETVPSQLPSS